MEKHRDGCAQVDDPTLWRSPLFNPQGPRRPEALVGPTTWMLEFNGCRYPWAVRFYRTMRDFYWKPEDVSMVADRAQFPGLTQVERQTYLRTLGFLIYLDSIQTCNCVWVTQYFAAPEVCACMVTQGFFETIHSQSYDYMLTSVVDASTRESVYTLWRTDPVLSRRLRTLVEPYEQFHAKPTLRRLATLLFADTLIEGVYFMSGFNFFLALGAHQKMTGTAQLIRLIRRDEKLHVALYTQILRTLRTENPEAFTPSLESAWLALAKEAAHQEAAWVSTVTGGGFPGLPQHELTDHVRWLVNQRCVSAGLPPPFPEVGSDPLPWLEREAAMNPGKTDFFEEAVVNYQDDIDFSEV